MTEHQEGNKSVSEDITTLTSQTDDTVVELNERYDDQIGERAEWPVAAIAARLEEAFGSLAGAEIELINNVLRGEYTYSEGKRRLKQRAMNLLSACYCDDLDENGHNELIAMVLCMEYWCRKGDQHIARINDQYENDE